MKRKMSMQETYAEKIRTGQKEYKPMKRSELKSKSTLKAKTSIRDSYAAKIKSGEKSGYKPKQSRRTPKSQLFSIFSADLNKCYVTGDTNNVHVHHIFNAHNIANSEKYGFVIPLRADWHDMADYGIHFNKEFRLKIRRQCEEYWLEHYGTKEDFIKTFGKWW